jgi:hypothetical protein
MTLAAHADHPATAQPLLAVLLLLTLAPGCSPDPDAGAGGDAGTDADTDTDTMTDWPTECTECPEGDICLSKVRGRLLYEDGTPVTGIDGVVKFHIKVCHNVGTDEDGYFEVDKGCYHVDEPFFMEIPAIPAIDGARTRYSVEYTLTQQEQISDQGPDDYVFDLGTHYWWSLPAPAASYTAQDGATVDAAGVQFDAPPGALGEEDLELGVFAFPLDEWIPPFIDNPYHQATVDHADALYFLYPYWQQVTVGDGLVLRIDPPPGWTEADTGTVHLLGDWVWEYTELPEQGEIPSGHVAEVGPTSWEDGQLVTPPIPVLGWVILVKD